ncbi:MAG: hypothetical protein WCP97_03795 [bacterium]
MIANNTISCLSEVFEVEGQALSPLDSADSTRGISIKYIFHCRFDREVKFFQMLFCLVFFTFFISSCASPLPPKDLEMAKYLGVELCMRDALVQASKAQSTPDAAAMVSENVAKQVEKYSNPQFQLEMAKKRLSLGLDNPVTMEAFYQRYKSDDVLRRVFLRTVIDAGYAECKLDEGSEVMREMEGVLPG